MALQTKNISATGSKGHHMFTLTVSEDNTSVANNSSTLNYTFKISPVQSGWDWYSYSNITYVITIGGNSYNGTIPSYNGSSTVTIKSGTLTIVHESNGSKSIDFSFEVSDPNTATYTCGAAENSYYDTNGALWSLTNIARASSFSLSASNVDVLKTITATITAADSSFAHTVEFYINDSYHEEYPIAAGTTSYTFTIPSNWYNYMSTSASCTAYCRVTTLNNDTQIGDSVTQSFTVTVPSTVIPTISDGAITLTPQTYSLLVHGRNKLKVTIDASKCTAGTGATIKSYTFSGPGISYAGTDTSQTSSGNITASATSDTTLTYRVTVVDSRGRSTYQENTIVCYAYTNPSLTAFNAYRASNSSGTASAQGTYIYCTYASTYSSVKSTNSVAVKLYYSTVGGTSTNVTMSGGKHSLNVGNNTTTYQVYAEITDTYGGKSTSSTITIVGDARILNISSDGTGFAVGKMSSSSNLFECAWPATFYGSVNVSSNKITSVATPTSNTDAANKKYVDDTVGSYTHKNASLNPACIEFTGATGHGGYIDFHYGGSTADYTSRIIESSSGVVTLNNSPIVTPAAPNGFYYLGVKSSLPSGADFNTYVTPGQWATNTYDTASTFSNCPYVTAGSLTVYCSDTTTNELHQIWESRDYKVYERYSSNGGSTWSEWNKRLTSANVVAIYSAAVTFSNGTATYTHSAITANSIVIVQRRSSSVGNNQQFNVHSNAGSVTICTTSTISTTLNLNIIIINN